MVKPILVMLVQRQINANKSLHGNWVSHNSKLVVPATEYWWNKLDFRLLVGVYTLDDSGEKRNFLQPNAIKDNLEIECCLCLI